MRTPAELTDYAADFVNRLHAADEGTLRSLDIDPLSQEAGPWYASWTRGDVAGCFVQLGAIHDALHHSHTLLNRIVLLLVLIAGLLAYIAWK